MQRIRLQAVLDQTVGDVHAAAAAAGRDDVGVGRRNVGNFSIVDFSR